MYLVFTMSKLMDEPDTNILFNQKNRKNKRIKKMGVYNLTTYSILSRVKNIKGNGDFS